MNLLNRKLRFWFDKAKNKIRAKMAKSGNSSLSDWSRVERELAEAAQLQNSGMDTKECLLAESKWWYIYFRLWYCFQLLSALVRHGFWTRGTRNGPSLRLIAKDPLTRESRDSGLPSDFGKISAIHSTESLRDEFDEWISSLTDGIDVEPYPNGLANPAGGTITDASRIEIESLV